MSNRLFQSVIHQMKDAVGGRVIGVTAVEDNLQAAINKAYEMIEQVKFDNKYYRKDIGQRALKKGN